MSADGQQPPKIRLVGVGGGGLRIVDRLRAEAWPGIETTVFDTDARELERCPETATVRLGRSLLRGLGCAGDEEMGRLAAESDRGVIAEAVAGADLAVVVGCFGRGCASGALPVVAGLIGESGCPTVAVVSNPFEFEGRRPKEIARQAVSSVRKAADCVIELPNDLLFQEADDADRADRLFEASDRWIARAIRALVGPLFRPGPLSCDLATFRDALKGGESRTLFSTCRVPAETGAEGAKKGLYDCPLRAPGLERAKADFLLASIGTGGGLTTAAFSEIAEALGGLFEAKERAVVGLWEDPSLGDEIEVTVVARTALAADPEPVARTRPVAVHKSKLDRKRGKKEHPNERQTEFDALLEHNERGLFGRMDVEAYGGVDLDKPTFLRRGIKIPMPKGG